MRILIFSWRDPKHPLAGGAEQVMFEHAKGWVKAGHKVTHFSSEIDGVVNEEDIEGVKFIRDGSQYLIVQFKAFLFYQKHKSEVDLIIDEFHGIPFFTPLYVKKKVIAVVQETAREVWFLSPFPPPLNYIVGFLGFLLEPIFYTLYKKIQFVTGSKSAKIDVSKFGIPLKKIQVWPHGVVLKLSKKLPKKEAKKTTIFLGVLSKDKGIEDALKCFNLLKNKNYQFWVVGKEETKGYGEKLKDMVSKMKLNGKVKFWGFVTQEKKFELLARSHVLINPSIKEGWGLVNIEANSVLTPVVSYESAGLVDSVKDGESGVICRQNSPRDLANNVIELLEDEERYTKFQKSAKVWSNNFDWKKSIKVSLKLIKDLC